MTVLVILLISSIALNVVLLTKKSGNSVKNQDSIEAPVIPGDAE